MVAFEVGGPSGRGRAACCTWTFLGSAVALRAADGHVSHPQRTQARCPPGLGKGLVTFYGAASFLGAISFHASIRWDESSSSLTSSISTPTHPRTPTYGGRKYFFGNVLTSISCTPGAAGIQIAM